MSPPLAATSVVGGANLPANGSAPSPHLLRSIARELEAWT